MIMEYHTHPQLSPVLTTSADGLLAPSGSFCAKGSFSEWLTCRSCLACFSCDGIAEGDHSTKILSPKCRGKTNGKTTLGAVGTIFAA